MTRVLLMNAVWVDEKDQDRAFGAASEAMRPLKLEGTVGRLVSVVDDEAGRAFYDEFMGFVDGVVKDAEA